MAAQTETLRCQRRIMFLVPLEPRDAACCERRSVVAHYKLNKSVSSQRHFFSLVSACDPLCQFSFSSKTSTVMF